MRSPFTTVEPYGIKIILLDRDCKIPPETEAMLQALYSRSHQSVLERIQEIADDYERARNFMRKFYIGYGHKSIGDCASLTLFVEGASILAVKAIQDWRLFSGQESSTRYIDFSTQKIAVPHDIDEKTKRKIQEIQEKLRQFYLSAVPEIREHLRKLFPRKKDEDKDTYERAIRARGFDIARGFLPAGMTTKTSWHMNLRQFADELLVLRHHPLDEVRQLAESAYQLLSKEYPDSFPSKRYKHTEEYYEKLMKDYYFKSSDLLSELSSDHRFEVLSESINYSLVKRYQELLSTRPQKTEFHHFLAELGSLQFEFLLDYGSFRDIQRHRALVQRMPILTPEFGFHPWYIENLPSGLQKKAKELVDWVTKEYEALKVPAEAKQYMLPMGFLVPCRITGDIKALTYFVELRLSRFVHPTLVEIASKVAEELTKRLKKYGFKLHIDKTPHRFDVRRGLQTILLKNQ